MRDGDDSGPAWLPLARLLGGWGPVGFRGSVTQLSSSGKARCNGDLGPCGRPRVDRYRAAAPRRFPTSNASLRRPQATEPERRTLPLASAPVTSAALPAADEGRSWVLTLSCPDRPGIVHAVSGAIAAVGANIVESQQFREPSSESFFMRVQVDLGVEGDIDALRERLTEAAYEYAMRWDVVPLRHVRTLVMVSREGHCLNDLLYRQRSGTLPIVVTAVVGNHDDLAELATFYGVPFHHVPVTAKTKRQAEDELLRLVAESDAELVVLARYMQVLSGRLCQALAGRAINIHHSFLPSFAGARPYHQAYARGVKVIGATAHYVTPDLDDGPIIEQDVERVTHAHDVAELRAVGRDLESRALARAVRWHAEHRVLVDGRRTIVFR